MHFIERREFLAAAAALAASTLRADQAVKLDREVGVTTSSFSGHLTARPGKGKFTLLELPKIMRDELGMRVIDLNTSTLASTNPPYLEKVRKAADDAGCILTNLKMNQHDLDMDSPDQKVRQQALAGYKKSIDAAALLGLRWARPLPRKKRPDLDIHIASLKELAGYAADKKLQLLIENYQWMEDDADLLPKLARAVGKNLAVCPDTGNWTSNEVRYAGLAKAFPLGVTCDFKAKIINADGTHPAYDLKRCFQIGWKAGFRGPWCLEHAQPDRARLFRELVGLREGLKKWMAAAK